MSEGNSSKNCRRVGDNVTVAFHVQNQFNRVNYQPLFEINVHVHLFTKITYCPRMWRKTVTIHRILQPCVLRTQCVYDGTKPVKQN